MGEYAKRKSDSVRVKIGTCEDMYYIRYEDRLKVTKETGSLDPSKEMGLFWRLPFPDEDSVEIGEYQPHNRGLKLFKSEKKKDQHPEMIPFSDKETEKNPGTIQLTHKCGLLINAPCYHGIKLPGNSNNFRLHWNGKDPIFFELRSIKNVENGTRPVVGCRFCSEIWSYDWEDVLPYVWDSKLKERLIAYSK